jgi:diacylglycerol kinase (ATP)
VADGTDAVVVVGGDGVIRLALQALARTDTPLGIIPAGTGNDHAREYAIPTGDPAAAADVVAAGNTTTVDLGLIRGGDGSETWFGTIAATGFDSLAIVAELSQLRPLPFRLMFDGGPEIVTDLTLAAFGNTRSYGGGMLICPNADHSDGLLDVTMVRTGSRSTLIRLFPTVFKGTHIELDEVTTRRARTVTVDSPGINAYADGDYVCPLPVEISAVPAALRILVPAR